MRLLGVTFKGVLGKLSGHADKDFLARLGDNNCIVVRRRVACIFSINAYLRLRNVECAASSGIFRKPDQIIAIEVVETLLMLTAGFLHSLFHEGRLGIFFTFKVRAAASEKSRGKKCEQV